MVNREQVRTVVGIIGNVISFGLFLSPAPTFRRICKKKSVEEFSPIPYIATVLNCLFWVFYGMPFVHPDSTLVITINAIGLVFELVYLFIFFVYAQWNGRRKVLYGLCGEIIFFVAMVVIALLTMHGTKQRSMLIGIICDVFNILMYFSPLTVMFKVFKTKSVEYMPFWLSVANFLNGLVWTVYALLRFDIYILISNGLGAFSGAIQLILYAYYYSSTPKHVDDCDFGGKPVATTEVQLSNTTRA